MNIEPDHVGRVYSIGIHHAATSDHPFLAAERVIKSLRQAHEPWGWIYFQELAQPLKICAYSAPEDISDKYNLSKQLQKLTNVKSFDTQSNIN